MTKKQKELLEHLLDLASSHYVEKTDEIHDETPVYVIPQTQPEKDFIHEVLVICSEILDENGEH